MDLIFSHSHLVEIMNHLIKYIKKKKMEKIDHFPHPGSLDSTRYLPAVYHEEAETMFSPLWTILLLMDRIFNEIDEEIDHIEDYFDIYLTPAGTSQDKRDFLSWLASWVGLVFEKNWPEQKKRFALNQAVELYKYRGTVTGLRYILHFYFGIRVDIKEWTWPGMQIGLQSAAIGIDTVLHERPNLNYCFTVVWETRSNENVTDKKQIIAKIRAMIDRERPAHTKCYFEIKYKEDN